MVHATGWVKGLRVTADGTGIVSHAGVALLRALAAAAGQPGGDVQDAVTHRPFSQPIACTM